MSGSFNKASRVRGYDFQHRQKRIIKKDRPRDHAPLCVMVNVCIILNIIVSISARRESSKAVATRLKFSNMVQDQSKSEKASVKEK